MITQKEIHDLAVEKGWWESYPDPMDRLPQSLMLMVSELAECLEEWRVGRGIEVYKEDITYDGVLYKPAGIPIELADVVIRARDTAEAMGIDLEAMIEKKHEFNKTRPFQHGNKRA